MIAETINNTHKQTILNKDENRKCVINTLRTETKNKEFELRKCPFCHSEMKIKTSLNSDETMNMQICCSNCKYEIISIYDVYNHFTGEYYNDKINQYINYWNNDEKLKNAELIYLQHLSRSIII